MGTWGQHVILQCWNEHVMEIQVEMVLTLAMSATVVAHSGTVGAHGLGGEQPWKGGP